jgi:hypothetical protein
LVAARLRARPDWRELTESESAELTKEFEAVVETSS